MTLVCGGELFTGNTVFLVAALAEKKATFKELLKNWTLSYTGNVIGALFMVIFIDLLYDSSALLLSRQCFLNRTSTVNFNDNTYEYVQ